MLLTAVIVLGGLAGILGLALGLGARFLRAEDNRVADEIEALLPQTQCAQCGYPGCRPYAEAIARGDADINWCPPGGQSTIADLAKLLAKEAKPLDPEHGVEMPDRVALIDESLCIGCKKCILACPVDAIVGAPKLMHTVIAVECTGCELCVEPCPVDCIEMVEIPVTPDTWRPTVTRGNVVEVAR